MTLANELLARQTHLVGTLRRNRKLNCKDVEPKSFGKEKFLGHNPGIVALKWKDKHDVMLPSTKHLDEMKKIVTKNQEIEKPTAIIDQQL